MLTKTTIRYLQYYRGFFALILLVLLLPAPVWAQVLEEIVVTAQRRVQSLQEVPISIETFSGDLINQQGFRSMEDLSGFSPSVEIDNRTQTQNISIRGMGTTGNNLGLESATPIFADGVHYARTSMIMGAFLDVERIEILRGPQPLSFGQNATAGAFSISTKKPTPEWEGDITVEAGNWERSSVEGGVGGPITDTLGVRFAGQYDRSGGYIRDVVTGDMFPSGIEAAARTTLQWNPNDKLEATLKAEWAQRRSEGEGQVLCRNFRTAAPPMTERAVTIPGFTTFTDTHRVLPYPSCDEDGFIRVGMREGQAPFHRPIQGINQEDSTAGMLDITGIHDTIMENNEAHDNMDFYNYRLGLSYEFNNGIIVDSNTAYLDFQRSSHFDNSIAPIVTNYQHRGEIFDMVSQEFRFLSPRGGTIEWEAGAFFQQEDLDIGNPGNRKYMTTTFQPSTRLPNRMQDAWQDTTWKSAFGGITYNFMDNKASLDVGARYTDIKKESFIMGLGATWIFNIDPAAYVTPPGLSTTGTPIVDVAGDGTAYGTNHVNNNVLQPINIATQIINCATGHRQCGSYGAGYWTHVWGLRAIPDAWDIKEPVAIGPTLTGIREPNNNAVYSETYTDNNLDPQVTLRYRPTDDLSLYAKWARAFKGGGADISTAELPTDPEDFPLAPEYAENFEVGGKGTLLDGAANYSVTVFQMTIKDMQVSTVVPQSFDSQQNSQSINAGKQRTRGVEADGRWQVSDHLRLGLSGAIMEGIMVSFKGAGCTLVEFEEADTGPCISEAEAAADPNGYPARTIDRSGTKATRTPDWKFVTDVDWWYPLNDSLKYELSSKVSFIDGYVTDVRGYSKVSMYDDRTLININAGLAGMDDSWRVFFWGRNILGDGLSYFREFHRNPIENRTGAILSPMNWLSYGVQFQYLFK
jgi:iron complex outermembrane recepter protein